MSKKNYTIQTYIGYTDEKSTVVRGRVLDDPAVISKLGDNWIRNFVNSVKRFLTDEVPYQKVILNICEEQHETITDGEGYFVFEVKKSLLSRKGDPIVSVNIPDQDAVVAKLIKIDTEYIVVSDIDDTIIKTQVSSVLKLKLLFNTLFRNQYQRSAVPGMAGIYRHLANEHQARFFYISKSPHNLYPYIVDFLDHNGYPEGSIILRDFGWHLLNRKSSFGEKYLEIEKLLKRFPNKKFLLVGDGAEHDADIYTSLSAEYAGLVKGIYIRMIGSNKNLTRIKSQIAPNSSAKFCLFTDAQELSQKLSEIMH